MASILAHQCIDNCTSTDNNGDILDADTANSIETAGSSSCSDHDSTTHEAINSSPMTSNYDCVDVDTIDEIQTQMAGTPDDAERYCVSSVNGPNGTHNPTNDDTLDTSQVAGSDNQEPSVAREQLPCSSLASLEAADTVIEVVHHTNGVYKQHNDLKSRMPEEDALNGNLLYGHQKQENISGDAVQQEPTSISSCTEELHENKDFTLRDPYPVTPTSNGMNGVHENTENGVKYTNGILSPSILPLTNGIHPTNGNPGISGTTQPPLVKPENGPLEPIAIVGMSYKFPQGANTDEAFWDMLMSKRCASTEFPADRMNIDAFHSSDQKRLGRIKTRKAHFLEEDIRSFDAQFFGIPPHEAGSMDPQHRILMETTYHALENGMWFK